MMMNITTNHWHIWEQEKTTYCWKRYEAFQLPAMPTLNQKEQTFSTPRCTATRLISLLMQTAPLLKLALMAPLTKRVPGASLVNSNSSTMTCLQVWKHHSMWRVTLPTLDSNIVTWRDGRCLLKGISARKKTIKVSKLVVGMQRNGNHKHPAHFQKAAWAKHWPTCRKVITNWLPT